MSEPMSKRIVLVDDDEPNRYAVGRILRNAGMEVLEAGRGDEALLLAKDNPDLVILDVNLPDMNGMEVCRLIKTNPATACIPVIHLSASKVQSRHRVQGLESGADGYLIQPIEPEELIATVHALLRARTAEAALRAAAREWKTTFDALSDAICLVAADGELLRWNAAMAELIGPHGECEVGSSYLALPREVRLLGFPLLERALESGKRQTTEGRLGEKWFRLAADPVLDESGEVSAVVQILTDITDLKQLEEAARQRADDLASAARAKDEFLAMLGHELRNPLGAISNSLYILNQVGGQNEPAIRQRSLLLRQIGHLTRMVDDLLDVSRITRGKIELRREPVDLRQLALSAVAPLEPMIAGNQQRLTVTLPDEPVMVLADTTRVDQIISNLLNNASKYTDAGGSIHLSLKIEAAPESCRLLPSDPEPAGCAVLQVVDTGIGISPQMLPRIFDLFAQVDQTLDRTRGGLGIGLTLVRNLVEMHQGTITAESAGPGRGSTFTVHFPLADAADLLSPVAGSPAAAPAGAEGENPLAPATTRRVLVIEDQEDARETLCDLLELWGFEVVAANSGLDGLEQVRGFRPDVALIDIGLPGLSGYEVARAVRAEPEFSPTRLIALTGYGQEEDRRRAQQAGFDEHLTKPVDPEVLRPLLCR